MDPNPTLRGLGARHSHSSKGENKAILPKIFSVLGQGSGMCVPTATSHLPYAKQPWARSHLPGPVQVLPARRSSLPVGLCHEPSPKQRKMGGTGLEPPSSSCSRTDSTPESREVGRQLPRRPAPHSWRGLREISDCPQHTLPPPSPRVVLSPSRPSQLPPPCAAPPSSPSGGPQGSGRRNYFRTFRRILALCPAPLNRPSFEPVAGIPLPQYAQWGT